MSSRELLGKAIEKQNNRPDRILKIQRKRNCETHRKTEESPGQKKPGDQEQRKNKITKARLAQGGQAAAAEKVILHSLCTELTKEDSDTQELRHGAGLSGFALC